MISIHALLAESDHRGNDKRDTPSQFLSTLSLRRATAQTARNTLIAGHFYPRSPCGERQKGSGKSTTLTNFYPRSPCGERRSAGSGFCRSRYFYPRSPCGERPGAVFLYLIPSIDFYPRSPCGERQQLVDKRCKFGRFLSTLSLRRATSAP